MVWLILGVALWSAVHFVPTVALPLRQNVIERVGDGRYRAIFSLFVLASLALIVFGWRTTPIVNLYYLPPWSRPVSFIMMIAAFVLFGASHYASAIKRVIRHPQLMSVVLWSISHVLTNGSTRALVLFGGLGLWALIEMPLINARDGAYAKPDAPGLMAEIKGLVISAVIFVVAIALHPYFAGVTLIPR